MAEEKIKQGTVFKNLAEVLQSLPANQNQAVVIYRPNGQLTAYDDSTDFFHPHGRKCLDDNLTRARIIDPAAILVFRGKI